MDLIEVFIHACEGAIELAYNLGLSVTDLIFGLIEIANYYGLPIVIFHWDCPVDVAIIDADGKVTSIENGIINEGIPGSKVITDGNSKTILLTKDISMYEIQTKGTGNGVFSLFIANSNGVNSALMKFIDISVDENSNAYIFFDTLIQNCQMDLDKNGDSIIDETFYPQIELIEGVHPLADAGFNQEIYEGESIDFDGSNSIDINGSIIDWNWDFGDGAIDVGTYTPTHVYSYDGIYTVTLIVTDDDGKIGKDTTIITVNPIPSISATIDFDPDTLNLNSEGNWTTTYIELPEGYDVSNIDASTIVLNGQVQAEENPTEIGDYDEDGITDLMVKFDRSAVQGILELGDEIAITITGELTEEILFEGTDTIRVIE